MSQTLSSMVVTLHGHEMHYVQQGSGPALLLLHGVLGSRQSWGGLVPELARDHLVVAPDLFGHGDSAKPVGDYSLGAFAATLRDLLDELGIDRVTLVGHSLGGGIAMQFSYLFPARVDALILVSSGGLGRELSMLLRAAALPGAGVVLPAVAVPVRWSGEALAQQWVRVARQLHLDLLHLDQLHLERLGLDRSTWVRISPDLVQFVRGFVTLADGETRRAFLATIRAVVDPRGQTVTAHDRLYLMRTVPTLLVWGGRDRIVPVAHAYGAQRQLPGSRLEVFPEAGHFPQLSDPDRFLVVVREFMTAAARTRLRGGPPPARLVQ